MERKEGVRKGGREERGKEGGREGWRKERGRGNGRREERREERGKEGVSGSRRSGAAFHLLSFNNAMAPV